jgi:hypothetical protein
MRRGVFGVWCGYVGVGPEHPLFGLPTNHPLALPSSWFDGRKVDQGFGPMDMMIHMLSGAKSMNDACPISLAFHVHGGCNYAENHVPGEPPGDRWWFGFDCGHAGDYMPDKNLSDEMMQMIDSMPEEVRGIMRGIAGKPGDYRNRQYVVSECQSLAAQLNSVATVLAKEKVMAVLMIGATERERIAEIIAYAKAHPLTVDIRDAHAVDTAVLKLEDRKPGYERPPSQHIVFPGGYRAAFSIEQQPAGFCKHLSVSVESVSKKGLLPPPEAVAVIAQEFGVPFPPDKVWQEEFEPGEYAVNLLSLYAPAHEGSA